MTKNYKNLSEIIFDNINRTPEKEALRIPVSWGNGREINYESASYSEIGKRVAAFQCGLKNAGFKPGDRIILMFPPSIDLYSIMIAMSISGIIPIFIDMGMGIKKFLMAVEDSKACCIISVHKLFKFRFLLKQLWKLKWYKADRAGIGIKSLNALFDQTNIIPELYQTGGDDHCMISFTSGSTGRPKGADRTQECVLQQHLKIKETWPLNGSDDVDMTCFPVFVMHNLACGVSTVLPAVNLSTPGDIDPDLLVSQLKQLKVNRLGAAPAFLSKLVEYINENSITLPHIKSVGTGGAPVPVILCNEIRRAFPDADLRVIYGSTEAEPISSIGIDEILNASGNGLLVGSPYNFVETKIVKLPEKPDDISDKSLKSYQVQTYDIGEIVVRGDHVIKQYLDNPDENKKNKIYCPDGEVWHRTGDTGYFDDKGRIWLTGRVKDTVEIDGIIIEPFPVEQDIDTIHGIKRSAIINSEGKTVLAIELNKDADMDTVNKTIKLKLCEKKIQSTAIKYIKHIPVDGRHNSKIDRVKLRKLLS